MVSKWIVVIVVITLPVSITHLVPYLVRFVTYKISQNIYENISGEVQYIRYCAVSEDKCINEYDEVSLSLLTWQKNHIFVLQIHCFCKTDNCNQDDNCIC